VKQVDIRGIFNNASKNVYTSTFMMLLDPLSSTPTTSSATKTAEDTEEDPDNPEGNNQMEYSSDILMIG